MAFLQEEDYKLQVREYELDEITDYTEAIRLKSELAAQGEMESYLRDRYNVGEIFGAVGDDRNPLIVMYMIDIVLYHIFSAVTPRNVPQIRMDRYDAAINWLKAVAKGTINPDLPVTEDEDGNTPGTSIFGSSPLEGDKYW
jgi:phage gp36-like protein